METRLLIAYLLIALLLAASAGIIWWRVYRAHHRVVARQRARERAVMASRRATERKGDDA